MKSILWVFQIIIILAIGLAFSYGVTYFWPSGNTETDSLRFIGAAIIYLSAIIWFAVRKIIKHFTTNGSPRVTGANIQRF